MYICYHCFNIKTDFLFHGYGDKSWIGTDVTEVFVLNCFVNW